MRVLHVLNAAGGGATIGALELMRTSRQSGTGILHFAVYPGLSGQTSSAVEAVTSDYRVIPMRWWNTKTSLDVIRRMLIWVREMQLTQFSRRTQQMLKALCREWQIDLIHTNTAATIDAALLAAKLGIPHIWHIRERIGRNGFMHFPLNDADLAAYIGSMSNTIVPMSKFVGEIFLNHGQAAKTQIVYDGVDPLVFDDQGARQRGLTLRRSWGVPDNALLVGKVAAVTSLVKRHEVFIRAAGILGKCHREVFFTIIGMLPQTKSWTRRQAPDYYDSLRRLVRVEGIENRFIWAGNLTDVGAMMNAVDIMAHACDMEGFGRVAIEAMAAGKPVVGPMAGGFAESVVDGETGILVAPGDPDAMARAIRTLVDLPDMREQYGQAGRRRVYDVFSPKTHLKMMQAIYETALSQG